MITVLNKWMWHEFSLPFGSKSWLNTGFQSISFKVTTWIVSVIDDNMIKRKHTSYHDVNDFEEGSNGNTEKCELLAAYSSLNNH